MNDTWKEIRWMDETKQILSKTHKIEENQNKWPPRLDPKMLHPTVFWPENSLGLKVI